MTAHRRPESARDWGYWVAIVVAFVLLILDLIGDGPELGNIGVLIAIAVAIFLRPGGIRRPRG